MSSAVKRLSRKGQRFIDLYVGEAGFNATKAAEMSGYSFPNVQGPTLKKRYSDLIDAKLEELRQASMMKAEEVVAGLSAVARDTNAPHVARVRAYELLGKIHGVITDKVQLNVNKKDLDAKLEDMLSVINETREQLDTGASLLN